MAEAAKPMRKCSECEANCSCGCQSNIFSLPVEVLEHIFLYEDPITLTVLERTSKFLFAVVSSFWMKYCKKNDLNGRPTPLCLGWNGQEDDCYSYDKAIESSRDEKQRWRILAVRKYLRRNQQCVVCRADCSKIPQNELFTFDDDVLLCIRCLPHFTITITHDMFHTFNEVGIVTSKLHVSFGTILLSRFIKNLRSSNQNELEILSQLQPFAAPNCLSPIAGRGSRFLQLSLPISSTQYPSQPGRCCCSVRQCSAAREQTQEPQRRRERTCERLLYTALGIYLFLNAFEFTHALVIMKHFKLINLPLNQTAHFILVSFVEVSLLFSATCYLVVCWYRKHRKSKWNQSFSTVLQCFVLACLLVEVIEAILTKSYLKTHQQSFKVFFQNEVGILAKNTTISKRIDWLQKKYDCGVQYGNESMENEVFNSTKPLSFDCYQPGAKFCDHQKSTILPNCLSVINSILAPLLESFAWTNILCSVSRMIFLIYVCILLYSFRSLSRNDQSESLQTIFTIS